MLKNYYQILDVSPHATKEEIKKAYKLYVFKFHPDKHDNDPFFNARFLEVQEAYDVLSDDNKRRSYDYDFFQDNDINDDNNFVEDPFINISVNKRSIKFGDTVKFIWETQNISELIIVGHGSYPSNGSVTFTPTKNTDYVFLFSNNGTTIKKEITITVRKNTSAIYLLLIFIPILILGFLKYHNQTDSEYYFTNNESINSDSVAEIARLDSLAEIYSANNSGKNLEYSAIIRTFLESEDSRDFERIKEFYSPNIIRYFNLSYPTLTELRDSYEKAWEVSLDSRNEIQSITKITSGVYQVNTIFSFYNKKANEWKKVNSTNEFKFDNNGKIITITQLKSNIIKDTE